MSIYIDDVLTFSCMSADPGESEMGIKHLKGKGLRYVPRTIRMVQVVTGEMIERNGLADNKGRIGLYNTNDVCSLEAGTDFDKELEQFGTRFANPMKVPYTINGAMAGWLAIRNGLKNVCLTVSSGRCGVFSALNIASLDFLDGITDYAIILGAHFAGEAYKRYNILSAMKDEVAAGILVSREKTSKSFVEITDCRTAVYDKPLLNRILNEEPTIKIFDSDIHLPYCYNDNVFTYEADSLQMSFFMMLIGCLGNAGIGLHNNEYKYVVTDSDKLMGWAKFKILR